MEIIIADNIGFCFGVSRAINIALELVEQNVDVVTLGNIIHNPQVVNYLNQKNIKSINNLNEIVDGKKLIIRSHGVAPEILKRCTELNIDIVDATCPYVSKIQKKAKFCHENDIPLIIFGEKTHPEIIGVNGWSANKAIVINSTDEAEKLDNYENACIVAQTTSNKELWNKVVKIIKNKVLNLEVFDSICESTIERQQEAVKISKLVDMVIVLGGKESSNTKKLYDVCKQNCTQVYHVETISELKKNKFTDINKVGIISGASTPDWIIEEGIQTMSDLNKATDKNNNGKITKEKKKEKVEEKVEEKIEVNEVIKETTEDVKPQEEKKATEKNNEEVVEEAEEKVETVVEEKSQEKAEDKKTAEDDKQPSNDETSEIDLQNSFMDDVDKSMVQIKSGMIVKGKVVTVNDDEVCVNIGYKADGIVTKQEFSSDPEIKLTDVVKEGDEFEVEVLRVRDEDGNVMLSRKNIESRKHWQNLIDSYKEEEYYDCIGKQVVKGGLIATINGIRAFIPASHLDIRYVNDITEYVGKQMKVKIIEIEKHRHRVVASRKQYILDEEKKAKSEIWDAIEEGSTVRGVVRRLTDFGAFVDIGGIDGLIHVTDLAWGRVGHPRDIVTTNEEIDVVILKVDKDRERISLGYKQTKPKPWDIAEEKYSVGSIITGKVVRIVPFGAFVELEPGLDGLIHISQVASQRIEKVEDVLQLNQEVEAKVLEINSETRRISLSIRALTEPEQTEDDYNNDDEASSVLVDTSKY